MALVIATVDMRYARVTTTKIHVLLVSSTASPAMLLIALG